MISRKSLYLAGALAALTLGAAPQPAQAQWFGWESLGGVILEEPECVSWGLNRLDCFARGTDRALWHRWWNGASWGGWESLGGIILEAPKCVSWGPNRLDCFARGADSAMWHRWWDGAAWRGWESLGGTILEAPECVSWGPNRIDCLARGTNRAMFHRWWDGTAWRGWESLGGVILEEPECVSWGPNRIDCFARGTNRAMFHRWWNGSSWNGWENLGGVILEKPECVSWGPNRIDCFARGTNAAMFHRWWNGSSWGGWENLGGVILEQPSCTSWAANRIDCFARGTNRAMFHRWWNGSRWGGWESLGGVILEQPSCVSWGPNRIDCFARGTNRAMFHRWFTSVSDRALTVSRHNTVTLTNARVDEILNDATTVLQTNDGPGDVACGVRIRRNGNVGVFNTGDGSIDTQAELTQIFNLAGNVKVVGDVNWCANQFNTSFIGCGQTPGTSFITERFTANLEGILWAHEFGHNQGLPHRDASNDNVMFFSIGANRRRVNQGECTAFRGSAGAEAAAAAAEDLIGTPAMSMAEDVSEMDAVVVTASMADENASSAPMAEPEEDATMTDGSEAGEMPTGSETGAMAATERPPVAEFVRQIYYEGLPLDQAAGYGEEDVDVLIAMLNDPAEVLYHENIALTLGMIGSERAVEPLIAYIATGPSAGAVQAAAAGEGTARRAYKGRVGAVMALGYIVNLADSERALEYLIESTTPSVWGQRAMSGLPGEAAPEGGLERDLAKYAIFSLGLSGNAEAAAHLRTLLDPATMGEEAEFRTQMSAEIAQGLDLNEEVSREGLVEYYSEHQH